MPQQRAWLKCICGFEGYVSFLSEEPNLCSTCQQDAYEQLELAPPPSVERLLPRGWSKLNARQKKRVEKYIALILAEQPRLF